jgi:hypothetical protein
MLLRVRLCNRLTSTPVCTLRSRFSPATRRAPALPVRALGSCANAFAVSVECSTSRAAHRALLFMTYDQRTMQLRLLQLFMCVSSLRCANLRPNAAHKHFPSGGVSCERCFFSVVQGRLVREQPWRRAQSEAIFCNACIKRAAA